MNRPARDRNDDLPIIRLTLDSEEGWVLQCWHHSVFYWEGRHATETHVSQSLHIMYPKMLSFLNKCVAWAEAYRREEEAAHLRMALGQLELAPDDDEEE